MKNCLPEVSKPLSRSVAWVWLLLSFLLIPGTQAQQVTRVGNLLTIAPSGSALANIPAEANGAIGVAATDNTSFALMPNGTVVAWGADDYGLVSDAKYVRGAKKIVAGRRSAIALLENGTLYAWGSNENGIVRQAVSIENAVDVVAARSGVAALKANGEAVVWGNFPNSPITVARVKKVEITDNNDWGNEPIAVIYKLDGSIQYISHLNNNGDILYNQPKDLSKTISISSYNGLMIAVQSDSTVKAWAIRNYGEWALNEIVAKTSVYKSISGSRGLLFIKETGQIGFLAVSSGKGWLDGWRMIAGDDT